MPEIPDLTIYVEALEERIVGSELNDIRLASPFLLRTVTPAVPDLLGKKVTGITRLAKQLVFALQDDYFFIIHLMISGRLRWNEVAKPIPKRNGLAAFEFTSGSLLLTEASKKKRASLRLVHGRDELDALDPGGIEIFTCSTQEFIQRLRSVNHTLKRSLTDQRIFAGIGNAYSDEILLHAKLSPFRQTAKLTDAEARRLLTSCRTIVTEWVALLRAKANGQFPAKVTAFHEEMVAHGKYRQPCGVCGSPIQRIVYAENEANYCATCQTEGRLLADRSLSRLLKDNWPKRVEDLEG